MFLFISSFGFQDLQFWSIIVKNIIEIIMICQDKFHNIYKIYKGPFKKCVTCIMIFLPPHLSSHVRTCLIFSNPTPPFHWKVTNYEMTETKFFCIFGCLCEPSSVKWTEKIRNHILTYCPPSFLHIYTHVLTSYTGKEDKILLTELVF